MPGEAHGGSSDDVPFIPVPTGFTGKALVIAGCHGAVKVSLPGKRSMTWASQMW
jgi:hypothetical protein